MPDARSQVHEEIREALSRDIPLPAIRDVSDEEIEAAIDEYEEELNLAKRVEFGSKVYVASEVVRRIMKDRGLMIEHHKRWADPEPVEERYPSEMRSDEYAADFLDALRAVQADRPTCYGELIARYVGLTDGLLEDLAFLESGDPLADGDVQVVCERAGEQFTATLETREEKHSGQVVDMDGLVDLLNEVVATTTDDERRFYWTDVDPSDLVGVFFLGDLEGEVAEDYFPMALSFLGG